MPPQIIALIPNRQGRQIVGADRIRTTISFRAHVIIKRDPGEMLFRAVKNRFLPIDRMRGNPLVEIFCEIAPELYDRVDGTTMVLTEEIWDKLRHVVGREESSDDFIRSQQSARAGAPLKLTYPY
jgi:hypothetical protein